MVLFVVAIAGDLRGISSFLLFLITCNLDNIVSWCGGGRSTFFRVFPDPLFLLPFLHLLFFDLFEGLWLVRRQTGAILGLRKYDFCFFRPDRPENLGSSSKVVYPWCTTDLGRYSLESWPRLQLYWLLWLDYPRAYLLLYRQSITLSWA